MSVVILRVMNMQTALTLRAVLSVPVGQDFLDTDSTVLVSLYYKQYIFFSLMGFTCTSDVIVTDMPNSNSPIFFPRH